MLSEDAGETVLGQASSQAAGGAPTPVSSALPTAAATPPQPEAAGGYPSADTAAPAVAPDVSAPAADAGAPAAAAAADPAAQAAAPAPAAAAAVAAAEPSPEATPVDDLFDWAPDAPAVQLTPGVLQNTDSSDAASADGSEQPTPRSLKGAVGSIRGKMVAGAVELKGRVTESAPVQKGVQLVVDKSKAVIESERLQQGVALVKTKTKELAESERVQRLSAAASDTAKAVSTKTQQGYEYAKEKSKVMRDGAGSVWERGRGSMQRVKTTVTNIQWRGSARETLNIRQEQWMDIKVQGAEETDIPARREHTCVFHVTKGSTLRWTFRVKEHDIGFGVRMRVQEWGGSREEEVLPVERYDSTDTVSGSWVADENRSMVLVFDNRYSKLRSKTVAYLVGTEKPPVYEEVLTPDQESELAAAPSAAASSVEPPAIGAEATAAAAAAPAAGPGPTPHPVAEPAAAESTSSPPADPPSAAQASSGAAPADAAPADTRAVV